jgi:hypothetical protein
MAGFADKKPRAKIHRKPPGVSKSWKKQGNKFSPGASYKEHSPTNIQILALEARFRLLTSRTVRERVGLVLNHEFVVICHSNNRTLIQGIKIEMSQE